ncbi:arsenate reductase family protein [Lacinutrix sp. 5H-3-7-4]|uniref:arsenate reductase family protein n=1 Tax=Lacinutrix sp. (strain 5H-3-7-4) TaxID=983544 RepID=UPI00020A34DB|nr:hypothetical protein [Lacinutrix sp. 5H-3-7-4]AEH01747.1 arsenate reductase like protein [Lacinutrix sp. 5H-3-7-4]
MSSIATNENEVILYYNSKTSLGKQTLPYIEAAERKIRTVDISLTKITGTQWATLAQKLNLTLSELVNCEHPDFVKNYKTPANLSQEDWIKILNAHPETLKCPILITGNSYNLIETPSKALSFLKVKGKDIDAQNPN